MVDPKARWYARAAMAGTVFFFVVVYIAFLFIQPELEPLYRYGSEYAVGRAGWLMKTAFFCWGVSLIAFALAMTEGLDREARSRAGIALFGIAAIGIFVSGLFDSDLMVLNQNPPPKWIEPPPSDEQVLHALGGLVAFFSMMPAAGLVSRRLRRAGRLRGRYRSLRLLAWLIPVAFVAFAFLFVPAGFAGLGQRIFLALLFTWLVVAARGLETGAFSFRVAGDDEDSGTMRKVAMD